MNLERAIFTKFDKLDILKYYPYGPTKIFNWWITGDVDLTQVYLEKQYKNLSSKDIIISTTQEIARAMFHMSVYYPKWKVMDRQRLEAFLLKKLTSEGYCEYNKKMAKGKTRAELEKLNNFHKSRLQTIHSKSYMKNQLMTDDEKVAYDNHRYENIKQYGIFEVRHFPLVQQVTCKPLYTKQELAAINHMVCMYFENLV